MPSLKVISFSLAVAILGALFVLNANPSSGPENDKTLTSLQTRIEAAIQEEVADGFSGVVLIAKGDDILFDRAYGSIEDHRMQTGTRFWISSTGKQFISAAILRAQEKGLLDLDDPLIKFFPGAPPDKQNITIRQLLAHLSGMGQSYASEAAVSFEEAASIILSEELVIEPGTGFRYSNNNFQLSVAILEKVSGMDYHTFLHTELLGPLGLSNTGQAGPEAGNLVAPTHFGTPPRLFRTQWGGQGMYSTSHDLVTWYQALVGGQVLSQESVEEIFRPVATISEGRGALGWFEGETESGVRTIFTRGNDGYGANSLIYGYPGEDTVIVVLTHAGDKNQNISFSRAVLAKLEKILFP